jgi:vitamin B12 transporter
MRLTAGAGSAFRAPTAAERFGFDGNPDLKPETSENLELGVRRRIGDAQQLSVSLFRDNLNDLIVFQPMPTPTNPFGGQNANVGNARVKGIEFSHALAVDTWDWRSSLIFQDPRDLGTGATLLRRAKRTLSTNLAWHDDRTSASLNLLFTGQRPDVDFNTGARVTDAGYMLTSVSLHRDLGAGFGVLVRLDNLFDVRYTTENGFNSPGRSLFLSLEYASQ